MIKKYFKNVVLVASIFLVGLENAYSQNLGKKLVEKEQAKESVKVQFEDKTAIGNKKDKEIIIFYEDFFKEYLNSFEFKDSTLKYNRKVDSIDYSLNLTNGQLVFNNIVLGVVSGLNNIDLENKTFPLSIIEIITGTKAETLPNGDIKISVEKKLQKTTGFNLFVNGRVINNNQAITVGNILLLPLDDIARELQQSINWDIAKKTIDLVRTQDSAKISLNLGTGMFSINGRTIGIINNLFYIDFNKRLVPVNIVESLTGTNIKIEPTNNNVYIDLDNSLTGSRMPSQVITDEIRKTPLTIQNLNYGLFSDGSVKGELNSYYKEFNTRLRYENNDIRTTRKPNLLSLDYLSLSGYGGTIGDIVVGNKELGGITVPRIQGLVNRIERDSKLYTYTIGQIEKQSINDPTVLVGGYRIRDRATNYEYGIIVMDGPNKKIVANIEHSTYSKDNSSYYSADLGVFDNGKVDGRVFYNQQIRKENNDFSYNLGYIGEKFSGNNKNEIFASAADNFKITKNTNLNLRMSYDIASLNKKDQVIKNQNQIGLSGGKNDDSWSVSYSQNFIKQNDITQDTQGNLGSARAVNATYSSHIKFLNYLIRYDGDLTNHIDNTSISFFLNPYIWNLKSNSRINLNVGGNILYASTNKKIQSNVNTSISYNTGYLFGPKASLDLGVGANTLINNENNNISLLKGKYGFMRLNYKMNRYIDATLTYNTDFKHMNQIYFSILGNIDYAPIRPIKNYLPNRGEIKGKVFLDKNYNDIMEKDENGIASVPVSIRGTKLSLITDQNGNFMIQNMIPFIYDIDIDNSVLPIGYAVSKDFISRVTIAENQTTTIEIPIQKLLSVKGKIKLKGKSIEGATVTLKDKDTIIEETYSAFGGQYGFSKLRLGEYTIYSRNGEADGVCVFKVENKDKDLICDVELIDKTDTK